MKLLGSILIIFSSALFGFYKSFCLSKRCKNLLEIKTVIKNLKTQIGFLKKDLKTALLASSKDTSVYCLFYNFAENLTILGTDKALEESLNQNSTTLHFTAKDIDILKILSNGLGKTNTENQLQHLDFVYGMVTELYDAVYADFKQKDSIYKSTGLTLGIFFVLLLI